MRALLYTYRRCPYAMRARMALLHAGVPFDAYEISLKNKPADLLAASPKATVPVLILPDGRVIEQSLEVMQWACQSESGHSDANLWWAASQTWPNIGLIETNDGAFKQHLDRYKYPQRFEKADRDFHRDAAMNGLVMAIEQNLQLTFLGGDQACAADVAIFPFVRQFRAVDAAWFDAQPIPSVHRWLQIWLASELFERCMKKMPVDQRLPF